MRVINNIEIFVIYSSNTGREKFFFDIVRQEDIMDIEHYTPKGFWGIDGGIEIVIDGYCSIFRSTDFHYLVKATSFLLHSLYWTQSKKSEWFDVDDDYPDDIVLRNTNNDLLRIGKGNENELIISYTSVSENYLKVRGDRFFENILISQDAWINACKQALSEYFDMLLKITQDNPREDSSKTMMNYYYVWQNIAVV